MNFHNGSDTLDKEGGFGLLGKMLPTQTKDPASFPAETAEMHLSNQNCSVGIFRLDVEISPTGFGRRADGSIHERSEEPSSQKQQHHLLLSPNPPGSQISKDNVKITLAEEKPSSIAWNPAHGGPGQLTLQASSSLC